MMRRPPSSAVSEADGRPNIVTRDSDLGRRPSARSLRGLDWLNFLLADVQSRVGPFLAIYLVDYGWNEQLVGLALTIGGIAGIASQTPAGAVVDRLKPKRALIAAGVFALTIGVSLHCVLSVVLAGRDSASAYRRNVQFLHARHRRHLPGDCGA